jgi:hypothetical protein
MKPSLIFAALAILAGNFIAEATTPLEWSVRSPGLSVQQLNGVTFGGVGMSASARVVKW